MIILLSAGVMLCVTSGLLLATSRKNARLLRDLTEARAFVSAFKLNWERQSQRIVVLERLCDDYRKTCYMRDRKGRFRRLADVEREGAQ